MKPLYTLDQVAARYGKSRRALQDWLRLNRPPDAEPQYYRLMGRSKLFTADDLGRLDKAMSFTVTTGPQPAPSDPANREYFHPNAPSPVPAYQDAGTLCRHLRIKKPQLLALIADGRLPKPVHIGGRRYLYKWSDVLQSEFWQTFFAEPKQLVTIYFIRMNEFIKIGYTSDLKSRVSSLQLASPHRMTVLHSIRGRISLEAELHTRFAHLRVQGEWFRADPGLLRFIDELKANRHEPSA